MSLNSIACDRLIQSELSVLTVKMYVMMSDFMQTDHCQELIVVNKSFEQDSVSN